jgi:hypothetical protein
MHFATFIELTKCKNKKMLGKILKSVESDTSVNNNKKKFANLQFSSGQWMLENIKDQLFVSLFYYC